MFPKESIEKTVELMDQKTGCKVSYLCRVPYHPTTRQLNLSPVLEELSMRPGLQLRNSNVFCYDDGKGLYAFVGFFPSPKALLLRCDAICGTVIKLNCRKRYEPISEQQHSVAMAVKREKQRTVQQVTELVKRWQDLHGLRDCRGNKIYTLENAARIVGVAKKTLDDYKLQIKLGMQFQFPFNQYSSAGIGELRRFVRKSLQEAKRPRDELDDFIKMDQSSEGSDEGDNLFVPDNL